MKRLAYLCLLLAPLCAQAQQSNPAPANAAPATTAPASSATDEWGVPKQSAQPQSNLTATAPAATPADPSLTNTNPNGAPADPNQPIDPNQPNAAPAAGSGGLGEMLATDSKPAAEPVAMKIKPGPKLNINSAGSYNKKAVTKQHKQSEKATEKRLRQTHRYQAVREYGQLAGIRRMQKGKIPHNSNQRMR